jgi:hypothetical protein
MAKRLTAMFERSRVCFERDATCAAPGGAAGVLGR